MVGAAFENDYKILSEIPCPAAEFEPAATSGNRLRDGGRDWNDPLG
jgi:hypothetical protein